LFCVVPHENRDEQGQDENCSQQVKHHKEDGISLGSEGSWLLEDTSDALCLPRNVRPSLLRNDLEKDECGISKVVEVEIWIGRFTGSKYLPFEWSAYVLIHTIVKIDNVRAKVITRLQFSDKEIQSVYGEWNKEAQRHKCCLKKKSVFERKVPKSTYRYDLPPSSQDDGVKMIAGTVANIEKPESPKRLECTDSPGDLPFVIE